MVIRFENPWLLLMLLPAAVFMYYTMKKIISVVSWRRNAIVATRSLIFILVVLLLAGFTFEYISDTTTTLFLLDSSDSIIDKDRGTEFVMEAINKMEKNDEAGIINFGGDSAIELLPVENPLFYDIQTLIDPSYTNLENALVTAQSIMPWDNKKRVVLITDGRENTGDALGQAKRMREHGYSVDVFPIDSSIQQEVQLQDLTIPDSVSINEQFEISFNVRSSISTEAVLRLYSNRTLSEEKTVILNKGDNKFAFSDILKSGGMVTYKVEVLPEDDTVSQNNTLSSFTYAKDIPKVVMVTDEEAGRNTLADILKEDMELTIVNSNQVPLELSEILKYDSFILDNISADRLNNKFLSNLETAVSHQGKGLLVTGGDDSYGPGGYYKTTLEKILPVNMDIKPKDEDPNLALLLVIDKSGSMSGGDFGISKMEMAREAAVRSTEVLNQQDIIGVIAFDDAYKWVVEPQELDDIKAVQDKIASIRSGGGTQILPPLTEAYESILQLDAKLKHVILLTDGQAEKEGYEPLIDGFRENGITLSTVSIGRSADTLLMKALAYGGRGRYYETDEFTDIPKIFAKEVFLAGKKYLTNRTFNPVLAGSSEILKGIESVPSLDGYVTTTAKQTANVIFESDEGDPVLTSWQYGLGRTIAWTPDIHGIWTSNWMSWENTSRFWKNILSWLSQQNMSKGYSVETEIEGQQGTITVRAEDNAFMTADIVDGFLISPDGTKQNISLYPGAPGEYKGTFTNLSEGVYIADITLSGDDGISERISTGLIMPYSPEYDLLKSYDELMIQKIAYEGGGRVLTKPEEVFSSQLTPVTGKKDPTTVLIIILFFLFMLDVALRRVNIQPRMWKEKFDPVLDSGRAIKKKISDKTVKKAKNISSRVTRNEKPRNEKHRVKEKITEGEESHISILLEKKSKWKR